MANINISQAFKVVLKYTKKYIDLRLTEKVKELQEPKDYVLLKDQITENNYGIQMRDGIFNVAQIASGIEIITLPKTDYMDGEAIDFTGMVVEAIYPDGSRSVIDNSELIAKTTNVTYANRIAIIAYLDHGIELMTTFEATIYDFDPEVVLIDFYYSPNIDGTYTITGWKGTLNGEPSEEIVIPGNSKILI